METFRCINCNRIDTLSSHGCCNGCGSAAVVHYTTLDQITRETERTLRDLFTQDELEALYSVHPPYDN